jgi:sec-independent protein translocase protein TatB
MFDIGWTELLVLAVIAILIVGPKDLPRMLYNLGQNLGKLRRTADDFRRQFNESMREAGMDDVRNDMKKMSDLNPANQVKNEIEKTFRDDPERSGSTAKTSETASETPSGEQSAAAAPSEGDILGEPDAAQHTGGADDDAQANDEPSRPDPKPAASRNANGAAKAKDAVS